MGPYYDHQVGQFGRQDPLTDRDILLADARRARAEATRDMFRAAWRGLKGLARTLAVLVRRAGARAALRPPHGHGPSHLTGCCN